MNYKALIQLMNSDEAVIKSMVSQVKNLLKALDYKAEVEIVCHGRALDFVLNTGDLWSDYIKQLLVNGVEIMACENMLKANAKTALDLFPGIKTVPAAIAELVIKQQEGWSYIKAGF